MGLILFLLCPEMASSLVKQSAGGTVSRQNSVILRENAENEEEFSNVVFLGNI